MKKAALYVHGKIVLGFNHNEAFGKLTETEQHEFIVSGFYDTNTEEFEADMDKDHFYDKEMILIRHTETQDKNNLDSTISLYGIKQAKNIADFLLKNFNNKDYVFLTSPLLRCLQTSQIIQQKINVKFVVSPEIMETPEKCFCLKNHKEYFPEFEWNTESDWNLIPESSEIFLNRIKYSLQNLPHKSIIVTHFGTIFNMTRLSLCENKAKVMFCKKLSPGSIISINKQRMERLEYDN